MSEPPACREVPFLIIAHRGHSALYPENTLLAFEKAIEAGAGMIELDIHLSRDRQIVVIHDETLYRTARRRGRVNQLTLEELKGCNANYGMDEWGFVSIPTLEEVIATVAGRVLINVEIKGGDGIEERLAALLTKRDATDRVIVSAFDWKALERMRQLAPAVKRGLLYTSRRIDFREAAIALKVHSIHPALRAMDEGRLRWAKSRGMKVYPWVVTDRVTLDRCRASGWIDGVFVNNPDLLGRYQQNG